MSLNSFKAIKLSWPPQQRSLCVCWIKIYSIYTQPPKNSSASLQLLSCLANSRHAISCSATLVVRHFHVRHFSAAPHSDKLLRLMPIYDQVTTSFKFWLWWSFYIAALSVLSVRPSARHVTQFHALQLWWSVIFTSVTSVCLFRTSNAYGNESQKNRHCCACSSEQQYSNCQFSYKKTMHVIGRQINRKQLVCEDDAYSRIHLLQQLAVHALAGRSRFELL